MKAPPHLIIIGLYVLAALIVDPRGEFPLNDDWSYSRAAFGFARTGRIQVDEWSAMSLAGQALYGGFLCKLFGNSFLVFASQLWFCPARCLSCSWKHFENWERAPGFTG